jgi:predicted Rossmann fold flavoprotein
VTNLEVKTSDFHGGPRHFVKHVFEAFTPQETIQFFKEIGVNLILEPGGKYFPTTHSAHTILNALVSEMEREHVTLKTGIRITNIKKTGDVFYLQNDDGAYQVSARNVILTTGGLSHPTTGSDGTGYAIAKSFGHTSLPTFPALTPLLTDDKDWKSLSGISLEAKLFFFKNGKKEEEYQGSFLFTHFGFSGPVALNISRHFSSASRDEESQIRANFLPDHSEESLKASFQSVQKKNPKKLIKNILTDEFSLPERFVETFLKKIGIAENEALVMLSNEKKKNLIQSLLHYSLEVTGIFGYQKAEVTAGGINLKEINVSTLESKLVEGFYFAGEILDVDGRIGGFNFQWAWSTGAIAGRSAAKRALS